MVSLGTMSLRKVVLVVAVAAVTLAALVQPARATIVERVVAVVGERPILLSELQRRERQTRARTMTKLRQEDRPLANDRDDALDDHGLRGTWRDDHHGSKCRTRSSPREKAFHGAHR